MALLWGIIFEKVIPDAYDIIGALIASIGVIIIFYYPRKERGEKIGVCLTK
jgi:small multidrug resistance family-3 protein